MKTYLQNHQEQMLQLLEKLVNIDSGSHDKAGVDHVGTVMKTLYQEIGFDIKEVKQEEFGNHLIIQKNIQMRRNLLF
ncbi:acetylornithine deacetylase/Succinyl-diaminopimelate desuccinylase and related deacylases [Gracilibacillus boraciitolerans JCM 21714]|uniref:Acetylornithine deacetylase/Succinyl-diaminopimelate desuccinylase and related deacylases n=1 Tax=Gracilibacillus boraciitolerans JCM 21714 TaxID=1298598 RepID=W4VDI4_9BACI|nr:acetylornithine deacetylase/Succinyl-diaminopimelate desuccinylase and related deacylases [Gracilibacillus boraciitolerans JCM 21714]